MYKNPFMLFRHVVSDDFIDQYGMQHEYIADPDNKKKQIFAGESTDKVIQDIFEIPNFVDTISSYYGISVGGVERPAHEIFVAGAKEDPVCENSVFTKERQWMQTKNRALTGILFLNSFNSEPPFNENTQCYGGKLEFPSHQFGFNPEAGTLVIFPSAPQFVHLTTPIQRGVLEQIKFHIIPSEPYVYSPQDYPGDYRVWFPNT